MLATLRKIVVPTPPQPAADTYIALVAQARNPFFYESLGVPDTIDGRFELIVLHLFLLQHRLMQAEQGQRPEAREFCRVLSELFFADMDRSVRELGVADTGVRYRIKAMAKAYHGRLQIYGASLTDHEALLAALARNLYGTVEEGSVENLARMASYVKTISAQLTTTEIAALTAGAFPWPNPASLF